MDKTSFFARDRLILVLGQKGDLTTWFPQIIRYARLPLKYIGIYLLTDKMPAMNLLGVNQYPIRVILGSFDHALPQGFLVCFAKFI